MRDTSGSFAALASLDLWHDLRAVTSETRLDWDLGKPGLRESWDAGDLSPFLGGTRRQLRADPKRDPFQPWTAAPVGAPVCEAAGLPVPPSGSGASRAEAT